MLNIGEVVTIAGIDWIVLDKTENAVLCLTENLVYDREVFDAHTNNYKNSSIRRKLNTNFLPKIFDCVGKDALFNTEIDLIADDGDNSYGVVVDKVGLITCDMYRKYNEIIKIHRVDDWWWTSTPRSTHDKSARLVSNDGSLDNIDVNYDFGVRPFCIFKASIFES